VARWHAIQDGSRYDRVVTMDVTLSTNDPRAADADLIAVAAGPLATALGASARASRDADPIAVVYTDGAPLVVIAVAPGVEGLRTAAARVVQACGPGADQTVAWALDPASPVALSEQVRALAEGAVLGGYDGRRWRGDGPAPDRVRRFVICGADRDGLAAVAARAALVARWCNTARELVDAPANVMSPAELARRASEIPGVELELVDPTRAGLGALAAVGASSASPPLLLVLRHRPAGAPPAPRLALIGKGVTFDTGGYFLKSRPGIVHQKADMAGGAAVIAALGAIAELALPVSVTGFVPVCENMIGADAIRPSDVIITASGLTVEVVNPDAEGRLILADALWYARSDGATHLVDLATLTAGVPDALGDLYGGVFGGDTAWRDAVADAGNAAGDLAWPLPLHERYEPWLESTVADLRNVAGKPLGFSVFAAAFLARFAGDGPWAHVDMLGPALLAEDRGDAFGPGASGYGVRMLVELATRCSAEAAG
jgi:leucyl aminopeptidase